ncbi:MAG: PTS 2-O-a-mannosyl-D-glycerate transporter subunit IIABC [Brevinema sp.]
MSQLSTLLNEKNILLQSSVTTKKQVFQLVADRWLKENRITSKEIFINDLESRELEGETALGDLLAIPHCKSKSVKNTSLFVMTLKNPILNWSSENLKERVQMIFVIATTEKANNLHIKILQEIGTKLSSSTMITDLLGAKNTKEFLSIWNSRSPVLTTKRNTEDIILAVTACPSGMAHTYMAAEKLKEAAREMGVTLFIETQGASGIDSEITEEILQNAKAVIFSTAVSIKNEERFAHLPIVNVSVVDGIKKPKNLIKQALDKQSQGKSHTESSCLSDKISTAEEVKRALMTGISHAVPIIVGGSMSLAMAILIAQGFGLQELYSQEGSWLWLYRQYGGNILGQLMVPIIAGYIAFSLADKPGLAPGLGAGVAANMIGAGFLGGMVGGFIAGYLMRMIKKIRVSDSLNGFLTFWLYPVLGIFSVGTIMLFIVGAPVAWLNLGLTNWLHSLSGSNALLLGAVIGAFVSADLGGPINKSAYAFCLGALANGNYIPYAVFASVKMVSAFASTFATMLCPHLFKEFEIESGKSTWILGLAGITEGAIPIMLEDPLRVIFSYVVGSMVTGALVAYYAIGLNVPGAGIFSLFLLEPNNIVEGIMASSIWFFSAVLGAIISTIILITWKQNAVNKIRKEHA